MKLTRLVIGSALAGYAAHTVARNLAGKIDSTNGEYQAEELLHPTPGEPVTVPRADGTLIHTQVAGDGPTVVLAHGYGFNLLEWNLVADRLVREGHRVITFDQRGHGRSTIGAEGLGSPQMAGDYVAVLEHHDVRDATLVGHSMGSFLTVKLLLEHREVAKERLNRIVLVSPLAGKAIEGAPQNAAQIPLIRSGAVDAIMRNDTYGALFGASTFGSPTGAEVEAFRTMFLQQDHAQLLPALEMLVHEDLYPRLGEIEMPVTVICGTKDRTTPPHHARKLADGIAGAQLVWVPGAGHCLNWEAVDEVVNNVRTRVAA